MYLFLRSAQFSLQLKRARAIEVKLPKAILVAQSRNRFKCDEVRQWQVNSWFLRTLLWFSLKSEVRTKIWVYYQIAASNCKFNGLHCFQSTVCSIVAHLTEAQKETSACSISGQQICTRSIYHIKYVLNHSYQLSAMVTYITSEVTYGLTSAIRNRSQYALPVVGV